MDITYIPMARGFVCLAAVVDWSGRRVLAWRLSITLETEFCLDAVNEALARHGKPEIFKTDQGSQFTSVAFTGLLLEQKIAIGTDGRGAWRDNVFVERLWRGVKYEEVYQRAYDSLGDARASLGRYLDFHNSRRPHSGLGARTPEQACLDHMPQLLAARESRRRCGLTPAGPRPPCVRPHHRQEARINRQGSQLSEPKRCSDKPRHLSPRGGRRRVRGGRRIVASCCV